MTEHPQSPSTRALLAACLGFAIVLIDVSVVNVALDTLRSALDTDVRGLQWVVNAYALVFAASLLLAGTLSDRLGARRLYLIGLVLFTGASLGAGVASTLWGLVGWRGIQGFGAALLVPTSLALLRQLYVDPAQRRRAVGWWSAGGGIALAAGPVLGGVLVEHWGWRSVFLINLPIGLLGLWFTLGGIPAGTGQPGRKLDLPGQLCGALALVMLTLALTEAGHEGWSNPLVLAAFVVCLLAAGLFLHLQNGNPNAMLPPAVLRNRVVRCTMSVGLIANLVFYGMVFTFSLYFQAQWHWTPERTGLAFLPMMGVLMVMNLLAGHLAGRWSGRTLVMLGLGISACGYGLMLAALAEQSYRLLILPMLLAGGGIALAIPTLTHAMLEAVPAHYAGTASGTLNAARQMGGVMGVALLGGTASLPGINLALGGCVAALLLAMAIAFSGLKPSACRDAPLCLE
ncbi:MFS transporter [Pseudomonas sp. RHF3.3-3]|uniref:MFS transporter n=1 Tax=Pseudomonas sp. RHF3.3-3 TaxID=3396624 RepID=UPI003A895BA5